MILNYLKLFSAEVFGTPEDVALRDAFTAQLVNLDHASKRNESHQSSGRQQAEGHLKRLLQRLQIIIFHACVHHIQEVQGHLRTTL